MTKWLDTWFPYGLDYKKETLFITSSAITLKMCPSPVQCRSTARHPETNHFQHVMNVEAIPTLQQRYSMPPRIIRAVIAQVLAKTWDEPYENAKTPPTPKKKGQRVGPTKQNGPAYTCNTEAEMCDKTFHTPGFVSSWLVRENVNSFASG